LSKEGLGGGLKVEAFASELGGEVVVEGEFGVVNRRSVWIEGHGLDRRSWSGAIDMSIPACAGMTIIVRVENGTT
jgi:hypothetical protein